MGVIHRTRGFLCGGGATSREKPIGIQSLLRNLLAPKRSASFAPRSERAKTSRKRVKQEVLVFFRFMSANTYSAQSCSLHACSTGIAAMVIFNLWEKSRKKTWRKAVVGGWTRVYFGKIWITGGTILSGPRESRGRGEGMPRGGERTVSNNSGGIAQNNSEMWWTQTIFRLRKES